MRVHPLSVPDGAAMVTPPAPPGCPWTGPADLPADPSLEPIPAGCDWRDTSVWITQASYPADPPTGVTYVYAHACAAHLCPLSEVRAAGTGFTVGPGDTVDIATAHAAALDYRVCGVGSSPKSGPLLVPDCGARRVDLVLVTCSIDQGARSGTNIVIAAALRATDR